VGHYLEIVWKDNAGNPAGGTELTIKIDGVSKLAPDGSTINQKHYPADQLQEAKKAVEAGIDKVVFDNKPDGRSKV
jgi:hypothetical protein